MSAERPSPPPACVICGGDEDLMDRGMAPGMTYCRPCRVVTAQREERVEEYRRAHPGSTFGTVASAGEDQR